MVSRTVTSSSADNDVSSQAVIAAARAVGAAAVSWTTNSIAADVDHLRLWQALGLHGEMKFMGRELSDSATSLLATAPSALDCPRVTVITLIFPYVGGQSLLRIGAQAAAKRPLQAGHGRIARYATGPDYHRVLPLKLDVFIGRLKCEPAAEGHAWRGFSDAVPTLERAWARSSGIGFQGKNTMLIRPKSGSFFFIAEVVTTASIEGEGERIGSESSCGSCHRCAAACPTAALQTPYRLDARRCISYLTIEKRGVLHEWERRAIGDWLFGCDICQEVCPFNHDPASSIEEFAHPKVGHVADLKQVLGLRTEADFERFCGGTPLERTRRAGLVRNAVCVAVNREEHQLFDDLVALVVEDCSPTVRAVAIWGAGQLVNGSKSRGRLEQALKLAMKDGDSQVRAEAGHFLECSSSAVSFLPSRSRVGS